MKRKIISYFIAFAAALLSAFSNYYLLLKGVTASSEGLYYSGFAKAFVVIAYGFLFLELVFFSIKDNFGQIIIRFIIHNAFSVICSFGGYFIYKIRETQTHLFPSSESVMKVIVPSCLKAFLIISAAAALLSLIREIIFKYFRSKINE